MKSFAIKCWGFQLPHMTTPDAIRQKEIEIENQARILEENAIQDWEAAEREEFKNYINKMV